MDYFLQEGGKSKKRRRSKSKSKGKKAVKGFFAFLAEERASHPGKKPTVLAKEAGQKWRAMSAAEKARYGKPAGRGKSKAKRSSKKKSGRKSRRRTKSGKKSGRKSRRRTKSKRGKKKSGRKSRRRSKSKRGKKRSKSRSKSRRRRQKGRGGDEDAVVDNAALKEILMKRLYGSGY